MDSRVVRATTDHASRAADAYYAMQQFFYVSARKMYREQYPPAAGDQPYSYVWAFEEAAKATLLLYGMPNGGTYGADVRARLEGREAYWDGGTRARAYRSYPRTGDRYYDDNDWVGSDLLQHHLLTGNSVALDRARGVFSFVANGWQNTLPNRGGVRWVDATWNGDRGTASTGGLAKLAAHLYDATGRETRSYLDWAVEAYDWTKRYLLSPSDGLYWNHMRADGAIGRDRWIYNQGVLIGAAVLLHHVTGNASYLAEARRLADAALWFFSDTFADRYYSAAGAGIGPYPGRGIFNAIFFRNLLMLHAVQPAYVPPYGVSYLERMQAYADAAWNDPSVRDASTGLFKLNGEARYSLLDQAGMVQVYAALAWDPAKYGTLT